MNSMRVSALLCAALLLPATTLAASGRGHAIHVDLSHVDAGLPCDTVGQRTQVRFDARALGFRPSRVEVLLNGESAPSDRIRYAWPEVTLRGGLSAGRNTVELIATREDGSEVDRSIVIKVGDSVHSRDGITLSCTGPDNDSTVVTESSSPAASGRQTVTGYAAPVTTYVFPPTVVYAPTPIYSGYYGYPYAYPYAYPYGYDGFYDYAPSLALGFGFGWSRGWGGWHHRWHGGGWHGGGWHR